MSKTSIRISPGSQRQGSGLIPWMNGGTQRLSKAKSSPNVSKPLMSPKSVIRCDEKTVEVNKKQVSPNVQRIVNSPRNSQNGLPPKNRNVSVIQISGNDSENRASKTALSKSISMPAKKVPSPAAKPEPKKKLKDSLSCTILEDRVLLKKGLNVTPDKLPKKPDELRKKNLSRSTSFWNVPNAMNDSAKQKKSSPAELKKDTKSTKRPTLNRATSLWSVPVDSMSRLKATTNSKPSRIPLSTQHLVGLGQSLGDLSQVDRTVEKSVRRLVDFDEVDRSVDEHIYENCQEAIIKPEKTLPIYENLKKSDDATKEVQAKPELVETKSEPVILTVLDLEKRAEQLMSQLREEEYSERLATSVKIDLSACRRNIDQSKDILTRSRENLTRSREELARSKENLTKSQETLEKSRVLAKSQDSLSIYQKRESEMSIQEIRRNWERQIEKCQLNDDAKCKKRLPINVFTVPKKDLTTISENIKNDAKLNPITWINNKRTTDIHQLVDFFNCKTTDMRKDATLIQDTWMKGKDMKESKGQMKEKEVKNSGYTSDSNSSEDSGHMSNENEADWKDEPPMKRIEHRKDNMFLEEIIQDLDTNLERTIEVYKATPIVSGFTDLENDVITKVAITKSNLSSSSGASSIDSWDDILKSPRKHAPVIAAATVDSSEIFFRAGALERLESQRDEKLTGHIILLQARCRGYLARRKLNTLKLQDLAVRCIQRNVRKLMSVREWPWWRLYVKVAPLLNVHRTEDQLKSRTEELEILRTKVEKLEQERNLLKHDNDKLEAKLSEMTADFAEEHSTSTLAAERIDAETSERLRLERELQDVTEANKTLQQTTERLEMELLYARAADLNGIASDIEDGEESGVYKQRYQHTLRELEFTKRKMAQQHEDDLEQLVGLKKQLEKKLADAYEEVEEQRQVVGQWKRRVQKLNGEMHDLRLLLEEQTARNNLLEKKQRKFDSETQNLIDDLRQEKAQRERLAREKEIAIAEKFTIEQSLSDAKLEIELKEERLHTITQELDELTFGGKTEEEVAQLKKAKHELEKKVKDQEEELDDMAGQVQLLESAKIRLEMSIEQQRKEMHKEMQQRDEELEEVRCSAMKKVKALEAQLESEHEDRTLVLRDKHELERRLMTLEEQDRTDRAAEAETTQRLKRDLKRTRALLRDAQTMLERSKGDSAGKAALRQLKNQLEDAECARAVAVKAKQSLEQDLNETQNSLDEATRRCSEAEERANVASRERTELLSQLEENEEELAEVLKKYRSSVQQVSAEQTRLQEAQVQIAELEAEKSSLKDQLTELSQRLESVEQLGDPTANSLVTRRLEFRTKELESKLELEQTTRARLETQIARLKENVEKLQSETALLKTKEQTAQDAARRLQRSLREAREEATSALAREQEATRARRDMEKALEAAEAETKVVRDDLRLALQRIDDLQNAIQGELDLDCSEETTSENSDSD